MFRCPRQEGGDIGLISIKGAIHAIKRGQGLCLRFGLMPNLEGLALSRMDPWTLCRRGSTRLAYRSITLL